MKNLQRNLLLVGSMALFLTACSDSSTIADKGDIDNVVETASEVVVETEETAEPVETNEVVETSEVVETGETDYEEVNMDEIEEDMILKSIAQIKAYAEKYGVENIGKTNFEKPGIVENHDGGVIANLYSLEDGKALLSFDSADEDDPFSVLLIHSDGEEESLLNKNIQNDDDQKGDHSDYDETESDDDSEDLSDYENDNDQKGNH